MKRALGVIIFAVVITLLVAIIVFVNSAPPKTTQTTPTPSSVVPAENLSSVQEQLKVTSTELASHNKQSDCWISYKGKVYDITSFLPKHPGSAGAIAPYCGTSTQFEAAFQGQHGTSQVNTMIAQSIYKGDLA